MMGAFDEESHLNEDFLKQFENAERQFLNRPQPDSFVSAYFDGELEDWLKFDIPIWLAGTWDLGLAQHPCKVWNFEGTECRDAVIVRCKARFDAGRLQFLIVIPEAADEAAQAEVM